MKRSLPKAIRSAAKYVLPPIVHDAVRRLRGDQRNAVPDWEYVPNHRESQIGSGWTDPSILEMQLQRWPRFLDAAQSPGPLGIAYESPDVRSDDPSSHNNTMVFGYVLGMASLGRRRVRILDWGGGIGHHYVLARNLYPQLTLDYHIFDLPLYCEGGRGILPDVHFHDSETSIAVDFDLVMASGSLQYSRNWKSDLYGMTMRSRRYLFATRLPTVARAASYRAIQRPHRYGYFTELSTNILNRVEFLEYARLIGLRLVREFRLLEAPYIHKAPEQAESRGYLFESPRAGPE
jgi:putative methyltransferase (TIGR04325 family)